MFEIPAERGEMLHLLNEPVGLVFEGLRWAQRIPAFSIGVHWRMEDRLRVTNLNNVPQIHDGDAIEIWYTTAQSWTMNK